MKKYLMAGTALVAATAMSVPGAQAAEKVTLGLGGFMGQVIGWADNDSDYENANNIDVTGVDQKSATEVYFSGKTTLDNGISVMAMIQLEADAPTGGAGAPGNNDIDESYLQISSEKLGSMYLGSYKGSAWIMGHRAPNKSLLSVNQGDVPVWAFFNAPGAVSFANGNGLGEVADINKITYVTPRYYGLGLGYTYLPTSAASQAQPVGGLATPTLSKNVFTAAYDDTLMGVGVGVDVSYAKANGIAGAAGAPENGYEGVQFGGSLKYQGFEVGGSWERLWQSVRNTNIGTVQSAAANGEFWDLGAAYATGPYGASITYSRQERPGLVDTTQAEDEVHWLTVGGTYNIGPGIDLQGSVFHASYENETGGLANENDGWGIAGGMVVVF